MNYLQSVAVGIGKDRDAAVEVHDDRTNCGIETRRHMAHGPSIGAQARHHAPGLGAATFDLREAGLRDLPENLEDDAQIVRHEGFRGQHEWS